jgi:hypothetical protein
MGDTSPERAKAMLDRFAMAVCGFGGRSAIDAYADIFAALTGREPTRRELDIFHVE